MPQGNVAQPVKLSRSATAILLVLPLLGCATPRSQELLPGLTYYTGPEKLQGKLVFLVQHDCMLQATSSTRRFGLRAESEETKPEDNNRRAGRALFDERGWNATLLYLRLECFCLFGCGAVTKNRHPR